MARAHCQIDDSIAFAELELELELVLVLGLGLVVLQRAARVGLGLCLGEVFSSRVRPGYSSA